jgi:transcriptional regulator of NAD metabolism
MTDTTTSQTTPEEAAVIRRHRGTIRNIARRLKVSHVAVSLVLDRRAKSKRIVRAVARTAAKLLEQERGGSHE